MKTTTKTLLLFLLFGFAGCRYDVIETKQGAIVTFKCDNPRADEYPWPNQAELEHAFDYMADSLPRYVPTTTQAVKEVISHAEITLYCNPLPCLGDRLCAGLASGHAYKVYWRGAVYNSAVLHEFLHTIVFVDTGHSDHNHVDHRYWDAVYPWQNEYKIEFFEHFGYYAPEVVFGEGQATE